MIWLTAVMTLIAGLPHFDCRCPDGRLKRYCLSLFFKNGCCCNGACCLVPRKTPPALGKKAEKACCPCCNARRPLPGDAPPRWGNVRTAGCQKSLIEAAPATPSGREAAAPQVAAHPLLTVPPPGFAHGADGTGDDLRADWHHRRPPPDRIIILQHFLV
jgi:hypothetical protein